MSTKSFAATVSNWVNKTKDDTDEVIRESVRLLTAELVRAMPYDTGNLSRSVKVSLDGVQPVDRDPAIKYADPSAKNAATLMKVEAGSPVYISITAPYAKRVNYGQSSADSAGRYFDQGGTFYFEIVAAKWQSIVDQAVANVRAR